LLNPSKPLFTKAKFFRVGCLNCLPALSFVLLSACAPPVKVAVEERTVLTVRQQSEKIGGQIVAIVQSGDTLYSIGFESNLDVKQLAAWNDISDVSRLQVGQRLRLTKPVGFVAKPPIQRRHDASRLEQKDVSKREGVSRDSALKTQTASSKSATLASSNTPRKSKPASTVNTTPIARDVAGVKWSWPFSGKVIRRFSPSSTQQGIDILGTQGQAVTASAPGEVVYVGNSLKGYGNLVIIKHNDNFLSAYAHNQKIIVSEGQKISARQVIGSVGVNNRRESALHFQIRRKGKPVNPLSYLSALSS
jgi:lipoprotein NlpD